MPGRIGLERRAVDDRKVGDECGQLGRLRAAQQVADEKRVPRQLSDHTHVQTVRRVGSAKQILHVIGSALHMLQHVGIKHVKLIGLHRRVVFPPDRVFHRWGRDHEFIFRRPACMLARGDQKRATLACHTFASRHRGVLQLGLCAVVIHITQPCDALIF